MLRGLLFLCRANSCRSQMAEGLARWILPHDVPVFSAGSRPTRVHPRAVAVLEELGIDATGQRSKSVDEIPAGAVDRVITLCAEGEQDCPVFPGDVKRLHWPLSDPDAVRGSEQEIMTAFRAVRDELVRRIRRLADETRAGG